MTPLSSKAQNMKISFALGADMTALLSGLASSGQAALTSLPPLPATTDLVTCDFDSDVIMAGTVTIEPAQAAEPVK